MSIITIQQAIDLARQRSNRTNNIIDILAVSKGQPMHRIEALIQTGQKKFGESYLQEALAKIEALNRFKLEWHFIGAIQKNKTREIAANFAWVHSIERKEIAKRLSDQRPEHLPPLNICLQINLYDEPQKHGIPAEQALTLAKYVSGLPRITLRGLMTILPLVKDFALQRQLFQQLRQLKDYLVAQGLYLDTLSMGMSNDFEAAILEGSTIVRIGSGIFGDIPYVNGV